MPPNPRNQNSGLSDSAPASTAAGTEGEGTIHGRRAPDIRAHGDTGWAGSEYPRCAWGGPPLPACCLRLPRLPSSSKRFILRRDLWSQGRHRGLEWATPGRGDSDWKCQGLLASGVVQVAGAAMGQGAGRAGAMETSAHLFLGSLWLGQLRHQKPGRDWACCAASKGSGLGECLLRTPPAPPRSQPWGASPLFSGPPFFAHPWGALIRDSLWIWRRFWF